MSDEIKQAKRIRVEKTRTLNLGNYESEKTTMGFSIDVEDGTTPEAQAKAGISMINAVLDEDQAVTLEKRKLETAAKESRYKIE